MRDTLILEDIFGNVYESFYRAIKPYKKNKI